MNLLDLLLQLKMPVWLTLLLATAALLAMALYRHVLERRIKELEHRLQLAATSNEKVMELVQERHRKKLDALDEVNARLMNFDHAISHLLQGNDQYAQRLKYSHDSARDLSRQYEALLGDRFY
jgi:hypothetical protein